MVDIRLKEEYLAQLRERYNTNTLGKILNYDTAFKLLKEGNANITMRNFYKLCKAMDWEFHFAVEGKEHK